MSSIKQADDASWIQIQNQFDQFLSHIKKLNDFFICLDKIKPQKLQKQNFFQNQIQQNQLFQINLIKENQNLDLLEVCQQFSFDFFSQLNQNNLNFQKTRSAYQYLLLFKNIVIGNKLQEMQQKLLLLLSKNNIFKLENKNFLEQIKTVQELLKCMEKTQLQELIVQIGLLKNQYSLIQQQLIKMISQFKKTSLINGNKISQQIYLIYHPQEKRLFQLAKKQYGQNILRIYKTQEDSQYATWTLLLSQSSIKKQNIIKLKTFNWTYLTSLYLDFNQINDQGWVILMDIQLPKLQILAINKNRLRNLKNMHKINHLQRLELTRGADNNQFSDVTARQIISCEWPNLSYLRLNFHFMAYPKAIQLPNYWQIFMKNKFKSFPKLKTLATEFQQGITSLQTLQKLKKLSQQFKNGEIAIQ